MSENTNESVTPEANLEANVETPEVTNEATTEVDLAAELDKWKKFARKHEDTVKALTPKVKEFEAWQESQKTESEKTSDKLKSLEAELNDYKSKATKLEVASKAGIPADLLDAVQFTDVEQLEAFAAKLASLTSGNQSKTIKPNPEQGKSVDSIAGQITSVEQLNGMSTEEINKARRDGRLDTLMGKNK